MTTKHTPGNWQVAADGAIHGADGHAVCASSHKAHRAPEVSEANARLIAAAPELLEALRAFIAKYDGTAGDVEIAARAAVAKAEAPQ